jgi:alkaline phosphatase D
LDAPEYAQQKGALRQAYIALAMQAGLTQQEASAKADTWVKGNVALAYANQVLTQAGASALVVPPTGKPHGVAYLHMGKLNLFDVRGSRQIVVQGPYDLYSAYHYQTTQKASENVFGNEQEAWLKEKLKSPNTWKLIVSSVSLSTLIIDLSNKTDIPDPTLRQRYYFTTDQWDGFPTKKKELLGYIKANVSNPLIISGDIHASFASVEGGVPTVTAPAISSESIKEEAATAVLGVGYAQGSPVYRYLVTETDKTLVEGNPQLAYHDTDKHGFVLMEVKPDQATASFHLIPSTEVHKDYSLRTPSELQSKFTRQDLRVQNGTITAL